MTSNLFSTLFASESLGVSAAGFGLALGSALALGLILAAAYSYKSRVSATFCTTLALLPAVVCVVIMFVNGNVGTGVAVAGAFSLVRFRSVPGSAKEICALFIGMGTGLICGMGYVAYALAFTLIMCAAFLLVNWWGAHSSRASRYRTLTVTVPEDLDYPHLFDDLFDTYTASHQLIRVKTCNLGSLFKLTYELCLKDASQEKAFMDCLRTRNGNLEICLSPQPTEATSL